MLYSRSRLVPAAFVMTVAGGLGLWALDTADPQLISVAVGLGIAVAASGLGGPDVQLDRTGAIPWLSWRSVHLLGIVAVVTGLALATDPGTFGLILRDSCGLAGLAAAGAAVAGAQLAWVAPVLWTIIAAVFPADDEILMWMIQPSDSRTAAIVAAILATVGAVVYITRGPRG